MLIDKNKYKKSLCDLWHEVFGDDYSFIELIFKNEYDKSVLCFGEAVDNKIVSAFYLIKNTLKYENKLYKGYYLYAAATLPQHRKEGLMSKLIKEAQDFCRLNGADFISLVPSQESLYSYYERFGFVSAMYRCESSGVKFNVNQNIFNQFTIASTDRIFALRGKYKGNIINYHPDSFPYACDCLFYSGYSFYSLSESSYLLYSEQDSDFAEYISQDENEVDGLIKLDVTVSTLTSPFELNCAENNIIKPYGMLCPLTNELNRDWNFTDIYMNIALD